MDEQTYIAAIGLVTLESLWRVSCCNNWSAILRLENVNSFDIASVPSPSTGIMFAVCYLACLGSIFLNIKDFEFFKEPWLRNLLSFLHAIDGFLVVFLGLGIYYNSNLLCLITILALCKVFLLYLLSRMVTGVKAYSKTQMVLQTTKTYLHHVGSFFFLSSDPSILLLTTAWRGISMTGHAIFALRGTISDKTFNHTIWIFTHLRHLLMIGILLLCFQYPELKRGFGISAVGHISYMVVRVITVFSLGSIYLEDEHAKELWQSLSDYERMKIIVACKYPWFSFEVALFVIMIGLFGYWRITITDIQMDPQSCTFS